MSLLHLPHHTFTSLPKRAFELYGRIPKNNIRASLKKLSATKARTYLVGALNEGLKQNLLGNDINLEFLVLYVRSFIGTCYNMAANKFAGKNH